MATAALLNHTAGQELPMANRISPMATSNSSRSGTTTATANSEGITANDFLTLLVTEMKNQDPTANTDPNEYINQLVNVNSLEQLININQTLSGTFNSSTSNAYAQPATRVISNSTETANGLSAAIGNSTAAPLPSAGSVSSNSAPGGGPNVYSILSNMVQGNLSLPAPTPAADRLSHALDAHSSVPLLK